MKNRLFNSCWLQRCVHVDYSTFALFSYLRQAEIRKYGAHAHAHTHTHTHTHSQFIFHYTTPLVSPQQITFLLLIYLRHLLDCLCYTFALAGALMA